MTYLGFLLRYLVPPIAFVLGLSLNRVNKPFLRALGLTLAIVYVATIPWDSLAIRWGIWWFPPERLQGALIGPHLPIEEAAFFGLQTVLVAFVWRFVRSFDRSEAR